MLREPKGDKQSYTQKGSDDGSNLPFLANTASKNSLNYSASSDNSLRDQSQMGIGINRQRLEDRLRIARILSSRSVQSNPVEDSVVNASYEIS